VNAKDEDRHPRRRGIPVGKISRKIEGRVYVICMNKPLGGGKQEARHYIGSTKYPKTAEERLQDHKDGRPGSAAILRAANERGIDYHIVRDWPGNPHLENQLKLHSAKRYCPECTPDARVPKLVQKFIKREQRSRRYYARKEAALMAIRMPTKAERQRRGAEAAAGIVPAHLAAGTPLQRIRELAENATEGKPADYVEGWDRQINADLAMAKELQQRDEIERERAENAPPEERYTAALTALADRQQAEEQPDPPWLPTPAELAGNLAFHEREHSEMEAAG
jgi:hypothetical protein